MNSPDLVSAYTPAALWSTSCLGAQVAPGSALEMALLQEHLRLCHRQRGRVFRMRCGVESLHRFVTGRLVTSVLGVTLLVALIRSLS